MDAKLKFMTIKDDAGKPILNMWGLSAEDFFRMHYSSNAGVFHSTGTLSGTGYLVDSNETRHVTPVRLTYELCKDQYRLRKGAEVYGCNFTFTQRTQARRRADGMWVIVLVRSLLSSVSKVFVCADPSPLGDWSIWTLE